MRRSKSWGFTLIELLVVIGMIAALATILLPAIGHAYKVAQQTRMTADLQVIGNALEAYKGDFGDYPRIDPNSPVTGAQMLCWALIAPGPALPKNGNPGDGQDGPGFRTRGTSGKVWGPYLPPEQFKVGVTSTLPSDNFARVLDLPPNTTYNDAKDVIADRQGNAILYYAKNRAAMASPAANSYVGDPTVAPQPMWSVRDNSVAIMPPSILRTVMGASASGGVAPGTTPITSEYLLISAGTATSGGLPTPFGKPGNVSNVQLYGQ